MTTLTVDEKLWLAMRDRVASMPGGLPVSFPAVNFDPNGQAYAEVTTITGRPVPSELRAGRPHLRNITLQIVIHQPIKAPNLLEVSKAKAGAIAAHFPQGLDLQVADARLKVIEAPEVSDGFREDGWWLTPIRIRFRADA